MYPVLLHLGPLTIYSYGLMMAFAFLTAGYLTGRELSRKGFNGELASTMVFWAAIGGLAGARVFAIFDDWNGFVSDPVHTIFSGAGFVWYGGLLGGFLAVSWTIRQHHLPWLTTVDCIAPGLVLAHGIGRIGCQLAGDGDWGRETTLPWGMAYPNAIVGWHYAPGVRVHPTPLYEFVAYAAICAFLWSIRKRPQPDGTVFWWYLLCTATARFLIEFVRINPTMAFGLSEAQWISVILFAIGAWKLLSVWGAAVQTAAPLSPSKR
jgi:phosphatidylglycerol---prolipoprotein diacylglyceryl transferase